MSDHSITTSYAEAAAKATSDLKDARQNGRKQLIEINKRDGTNVWFCMAQSYEMDGNYEAGGQAYEKGAYLGHRASIFRLILLRKRGFINFRLMIGSERRQKTPRRKATFRVGFCISMNRSPDRTVLWDVWRA